MLTQLCLSGAASELDVHLCYLRHSSLNMTSDHSTAWMALIANILDDPSEVQIDSSQVDCSPFNPLYMLWHSFYVLFIGTNLVFWLSVSVAGSWSVFLGPVCSVGVVPCVGWFTAQMWIKRIRLFFLLTRKFRQVSTPLQVEIMIKHGFIVESKFEYRGIGIMLCAAFSYAIMQISLKLYT